MLREYLNYLLIRMISAQNMELYMYTVFCVDNHAHHHPSVQILHVLSVNLCSVFCVL